MTENGDTEEYIVEYNVNLRPGDEQQIKVTIQTVGQSWAAKDVVPWLTEFATMVSGCYFESQQPVIYRRIA